MSAATERHRFDPAVDRHGRRHGPCLTCGRYEQEPQHVVGPVAEARTYGDGEDIGPWTLTPWESFVLDCVRQGAHGFQMRKRRW
jgi:hypothetical protein